MSAIEADIVRAKENLQSALGERYIDYMQSMKKWFAGKSSKEEFDREARELVTNNNVHLHNEFLLCIITKCNNFDSIATEAATAPKTIFPLSTSGSSLLSSFSASTSKNTVKSKKKSKTSDSSINSKPLSYHLRFVPVDPIKHAPSMITSSIEMAAKLSENFSLEFCARERSLPYAKMIHAVEHNLQTVDIKAVFLLAEATTVMLKNIITRLVSRSKFKHDIRMKAAYNLYEKNTITDKKLLEKRKKRLIPNDNFEIDPVLIDTLKSEIRDEEENKEIFNQQTYEENIQKIQHNDGDDDKEEFENLSNELKDPMNVPIRKLPITLFDLKNLLQLDKSLMPSHSVYTQNMERIICNLWHECPDE